MNEWEQQPRHTERVAGLLLLWQGGISAGNARTLAWDETQERVTPDCPTPAFLTERASRCCERPFRYERTARPHELRRSGASFRRDA
jgi:hypothetical protein